MAIGLMNLFGLDWGFLTWLVGLGGGLIFVVGTFLFNIAKYVIVVATAIEGAGIVVITMMAGYSDLTWARFIENPVRIALQDSPVWAIFFILLSIVGIGIQLITTKSYEPESYEARWAW